MHRYWMFVLLVVLVAVGCSGSAAADTEPAAVATQALAMATLAPTLPRVTSMPESPTATPEPSKPTLAPMLPAGVIAGQVRDAEGSVAGAIVRVRLTEHESTTATDGSFTLSDLAMTEPVSVTAWAEGYYVGVADGTPGLVPITITLKPHYTTDNLDHGWFEFQGVEGSASCAPCHTANAEWERDAHSQSAVNPRFITMYEGTDVHGNKSPSSYDASGRIQPPDLSQPYYGPGYRLDYRDRAGNCAACHTPLADNLEPSNTCGWSGCHTELTGQRSSSVPDPIALPSDQYGVSPTDLTGNAADGVGCDFCHKIGDVYLNPHTGLPYPDRPGISSLRLYRPEEGEQLFFGTFDDVTRRVSYLPLVEESAFCAPCHYGVFGGVVAPGEVAGGVVVYNSFGEWLESPYSDPETGQTCQDCHMPVIDDVYFANPEQGGLQPRYPIHSHLMPGAKDEALLQNSVTMTTTAQAEGGRVLVRVSVTNDKTGHHVPTGVPLRQMLLVVQAVGADDNPLPLLEGALLPDWAGDYAGHAGRYYAKILQDAWTGDAPTGAYWRDIRLVEDTRLAATATDTSQYAFAAPATGTVVVEARLVFRRAFQELMRQKGWDDPDILMEEETITIAAR
jgi:mono/diheme cytochrome c family protein